MAQANQLSHHVYCDCDDDVDEKWKQDSDDVDCSGEATVDNPIKRTKKEVSYCKTQ